MTIKVSLADIQDEICQIRKKYPKLKDDSAFVFWFMRAYIVDTEEEAKGSLTGSSGDKNIDAIFIDKDSRQIHLIQGKLHNEATHNEKRNDVMAFADLSTYPWADNPLLEKFYKKLDPLTRKKFQQVVHYVKNKKYELYLYYVTTGQCSETIINEAKEKVRKADGYSKISILDHDKVLIIYKDYLEGAAPPVQTLTLKMVSEGAIRHQGILNRFDPEKGIESWVFSMSAKNVGELYRKAGMRLFARNVRGYLGDTRINEAMEKTLKGDPSNFWYYNNGITMVCDDARREASGGNDVLIVEKAQVINGQQTTITLSNTSSEKAHILVKVLKIPRSSEEGDIYGKMVNSIVKATNWQNHILSSDLVSNDYIQVFIEREMRKRGYQYIRKRMSKKESRSLYGGIEYQIKKDELAQAVGACEFDPYYVRRGKEHLFEDPLYKSIFSSKTMAYYLSRYWLMRQVKRISRGYPERAYAKWLVLHFIWNEVGDMIGRGNTEKQFRIACEQNDKEVLSPLHKAITQVFRGMLQYYELNKGEGEKKQDVSAFFMGANMIPKIEKFWNSEDCAKSKRATERSLGNFRTELERVEIE